jgi:hypothetical protein
VAIQYAFLDGFAFGALLTDIGSQKRAHPGALAQEVVFFGASPPFRKRELAASVAKNAVLLPFQQSACWKNSADHPPETGNTLSAYEKRLWRAIC